MGLSMEITPQGHANDRENTMETPDTGTRPETESPTAKAKRIGNAAMSEGLAPSGARTDQRE